MNNNLRSQYIHETETTDVQEETEQECSPFFVDLTKLPSNQLDHLRDCGLLSKADIESYDLCLLYNQHEDFLQKVYGTALKPSFVSLDASRPWMIYWTLHGLDLMDRLPPLSVLDRIVSTLQHCWQSTTVTFQRKDIQHDPILKSFVVEADKATNTITIPAGGFGGGPGQLAHCATSYAAILALSIVASATAVVPVSDSTTTSTTTDAKTNNAALQYLQEIRTPLYAWYLSLQQHDGGFRMHHDGEVDVRATYTMLAVTSLLNITTSNLTQNAASYIASCQTYEGGFGGEPFAEAHGGYAFCAVAALQLLNALNDDSSTTLDIDNLRGWLARRQMSFEGGFAGRSNKLVDGCYSFWQGGAMAIISALYDDNSSSSNKSTNTNNDNNDTTDKKDSSMNGSLYHPSQDGWLSLLPSPPSSSSQPSCTPPNLLLFDEKMLQRYILLCAQDPNGGLRDKPSKARDFYHSCYNLSGLSVTQHFGGGDDATISEQNDNHKEDDDNKKNVKGSSSFGHPVLSRVAATHPLFNIRIDRAIPILQHFYN